MTSNKKFIILAIISFLILALIYSSLVRPNAVFAKYSCENFGDLTVKCCDNITDKNGETRRYCTTCTNSEPPSNCSPRYLEAHVNPPDSQPTNVYKPSPTPSNTMQPSHIK